MATGAGGQPESPGVASRGPAMHRLLVIGGIALAAIAVVLGTLLLIDGGDPGKGDGGRTASTPGRTEQTFPLALYTITLPAGWDLSTADEPEGSILESIWHNHASPTTSLWVGARVPAPQKRPVGWARSRRASARRSPGYREIAFGPTSLAGRPAMRWTFDIAGKRRVAYFLDECEVGAMIVGSTPPSGFGDHAADFRRAASSLKVRC